MVFGRMCDLHHRVDLLGDLLAGLCIERPKAELVENERELSAPDSLGIGVQRDQSR
jgi:hypothetical protein